VLIAFDHMIRPIALDGCDELKSVLESIVHGWKIREVDAGDAPAPAITVTRTKTGYSRTSEWLSQPAVYTDKVNATCDLLVDVFKCYLADNPSLLCLHGAAVSFGDGLILFPSSYNAGKSTLSVHLAALGARIYADDVLYILEDGNQGMATGVQPRLRLPLPENTSKAFLDFISARKGTASDRFLYLKPDSDELARYGEKAPVKVMIELERDQAKEMALKPAGTGDILKRTIMQNFSHEIPALETLERLHKLVNNADCYTLTYNDSDLAARYLKETFAK